MDDVQNAIEVTQFDRALDPVMADLRATGGPLPLSIGRLYGDTSITRAGSLIARLIAS